MYICNQTSFLTFIPNCWLVGRSVGFYENPFFVNRLSLHTYMYICTWSSLDKFVSADSDCCRRTLTAPGVMQRVYEYIYVCVHHHNWKKYLKTMATRISGQIFVCFFL